MQLIRTAVVVCVLGVAAAAHGQAFEIASIRPSAPNAPRGGFGVSPSGLFRAEGLSLVELIQGAYSSGLPLYRFQITGGPDWMDTARFDINATSSIRNATPAQTMQMVKALLVDRFKLVAREEMKDGPTYLLNVLSRDGKLGPKMRPSSVACPVPGATPPAPASPDAFARCVYNVGYGTLTARGATTARLALSLANFYGIGRLVIDRTGLTGAFDMDMEWAPLVQFRQPGNLDPPTDAAERPVNNGPTIFVALREQLGLSLDPGRGPVSTVVVERAERPSSD